MEVSISIEELRTRKIFVATPMYGGQCSGQFTKSSVDLARLGMKYEMDIREFYLFNESLITRARNYLADEFLRSNCTHLLFIDSDIGFDANDVLALAAIADPDSDKDVVCAPYPKKCLHHSTKVVTEDGTKTISDIVSNKYTGKVLSVDDATNTFVWKNVTNHWREPNTTKKWVSIQSAAHSLNTNQKRRGSVIVTSDHEVAYIENVLADIPTIRYTRADDMMNRWAVFIPKLLDTSNRNDRHPLLNKEQLSILIGMALGDGCITKGNYAAVHSIEQTAYNAHKYSIIGGRFNTNNKDGLSSHTFKNAQTEALSELLYEGKQKTLKNILSLFDASSLAFMYMDDGNRYYYPENLSDIDTTDHSWWYNDVTTIQSSVRPGDGWQRGRKAETYRGTSSIATMSFTYDDHLLFVEFLKSKFDLDALIYKQGNHYGIKFDKNNTDKLHELISPYVPECMEYKLNEKYRGGKKKQINIVPHAVSARKILAVGDYDNKNNSYLYDIEVEDNHNLVVNDGIVVHNCISWEKIKRAVDKGFGDKDPNNLENYVGDYVFNPAAGTSEIRIDQPVEVLESGTGFMMVQRRVFEKFAAAYPHLSYRPDHVRTEHFDGSRKIHAYFNTPIDPESERFLSEDYMFCQYVRKAGMKVWFCPWMRLSHMGSYVFTGSLSDLAQLGVSPTADVQALGKTKKLQGKIGLESPTMKE